MIGLDENCLRSMNSSEILKQDFLRCESKENISGKQNLIQKAFLKASIANEPIHAQKSDVTNPQKKTESVISEKSLLTIEGSFKKRDAKNIQRIKDTTQILTIYDPDQVNFDVQFNLILNAFKNLKSSSSKLAAFLYILDSTKDKESSKIQINNKKIYKELPRKCKKLIKKSNPKFSLDMQSTESLKSIESIRAHLKKRSIFIK